MSDDEPDWWNLPDPSFGLNRRFQTELKAALTDYVEDAMFWVSESYEDDEDPDPGGLYIQFAVGPDGYLRQRKSILKLLQEFVTHNTRLEWYDHPQPELERARRLIAAWNAPDEDDPS